MLEEILPQYVAVAATRCEIEAELFPEERRVVDGANDGRRREFVTARACAHTALARLGLPPQAIPCGERGAPQWPAGIIGSITHCDGYWACAAGHLADVGAIGIDAEPNFPLPRGVLDKIVLPEECAWLCDLADDAPEVCWDRLVFSIKESVYKAWFPLARRWLGFGDVVITIDRQHNTFVARFRVPGPSVERQPLTGFSGGWLVRNGLLLAATVLPAEPPSPTTASRSTPA